MTPSGQLDTTFNGTGFATTAFQLPYLFWPMDAASTPDGGLLVAGIFKAAQTRVAVCKFTATGGLDTNFGAPLDGGCPLLPGDVLAADDMTVRGRLVAIVPHFGGYVVAATGVLGNSTQIRITRLNANGAVDTLFGTNGVTEIAHNSYSSFQTHAVAVTPDGRIFVAGTVKFQGGDAVYLAGFTPMGLADYNDWDFKGFKDFFAGTFGGTNRPVFSSLHVRSNGELVAGGSVDVGAMPANVYGLIVRLDIATKNGVFPQNNEFPLPLTGQNFLFYACDVCTKNEIVDIDETSDGTMYLTGTFGANGNDDTYVVRLNGFVPDPSFGYQGVQLFSYDALPIASVQDKAADLVINAGVVTLVGQHGSGSPAFPVFTRLSADLIFKNGFD